jgi:uncharacterized protein (TIGR03435 family)
MGALLFLWAAVTLGQTFEVTSIRPSGPKSVRGSDGGPGDKDPTRYIFGRASLIDLILVAYHVEPFQVASKAPLDRDEFDLAARVPADATRDEFRVMLRNLLGDRFHVKIHIESRQFPAFEMVVVKGGAKLGTRSAARVASQSDFPELTPGKPGLISLNSMSRGYQITRMRAQQQPLSRLAQFLRIAEPRPVVDQTGLTGNYDFVLEFSRELPNSTDSPEEAPSVPDLNTALLEQLGLQLVAKKLPFDVVVVESFDRLPTEN